MKKYIIFIALFQLTVSSFSQGTSSSDIFVNVKPMNSLDTTRKFSVQEDTFTKYNLDFNEFNKDQYNRSKYSQWGYTFLFNSQSKIESYIMAEGYFFVKRMEDLVHHLLQEIEKNDFNYGNNKLNSNIINMSWLDSANPYNPDYCFVIEANGENCTLRVLIAAPCHLYGCGR